MLTLSNSHRRVISQTYKSSFSPSFPTKDWWKKERERRWREEEQKKGRRVKRGYNLHLSRNKLTLVPTLIVHMCFDFILPSSSSSIVHWDYELKVSQNVVYFKNLISLGRCANRSEHYFVLEKGVKVMSHHKPNIILKM